MAHGLAPPHQKDITGHLLDIGDRNWRLSAGSPKMLHTLPTVHETGIGIQLSSILLQGPHGAGGLQPGLWREGFRTSNTNAWETSFN